jgi:hypothetical protein
MPFYVRLASCAPPHRDGALPPGVEFLPQLDVGSTLTVEMVAMD